MGISENQEPGNAGKPENKGNRPASRHDAEVAKINDLIAQGRECDAKEAMDKLWKDMEALTPGAALLPKECPTGWKMVANNDRGICYQSVTTEDMFVRLRCSVYGQTIWIEMFVSGCKVTTASMINLKNTFLGKETAAMVFLGPDSINDDMFPHSLVIRACISHATPNFWSKHEGSNFKD